MSTDIYQDAIQHSTCAFAYHRAVFDQNNHMVDYIFLDVNPAFEALTGLLKDNIVNRRFVQEIAQDQVNAQKWVRQYEKVLQENKTVEFEDYSSEFRKQYAVIAYPVGDQCFVTLFQNITFEKKMQEIAQYLISNMGDTIDYDKLTSFAYDVSGAEYAAFNLFDENGKDFTTVSIYGSAEKIEKALNFLALDIVGKKWAYDLSRESKIKNNTINIFDDLSDLVGDVLPAEVISQLVNRFDLGQIVIAKIAKNNKTLGDFTLLFSKGQHLKNRDLFQLYLSQLGLFIEKTSLEKSLVSSQKQFYTLAQYAPIGFISCNTSGDILFANKRLLEIMDFPSSEAISQINLFDVPALQKSDFSDMLKDCINKARQLTYEMGYTSIWGRKSWLRIHFTPHQEGDTVVGASIVIDDISDKKETEDDLREKMQRDSLTRAYNRHVLETILIDRINESEDQQLTSCVAVVDIDDFKSINDHYGHRAGDDVLKYLSTRIKQELRDQDLLVRTGGDEFLLYLHNIKNEANAANFIKRIYDKISADYRMEAHINGSTFLLNVHCSIGVCFYPKHGTTADALMARADAALYKVKNSGKANVHIEP